MRDLTEHNPDIVPCILQLSRVYFVDLLACMKQLFALDIEKEDIPQMALVVAQNLQWHGGSILDGLSLTPAVLQLYEQLFQNAGCRELMV